ncbi:MAG: hypothetical protein Q8O76_02200, partial [Chloroflexota bacterium]|nr:hypothetical protein [Chloroflexota bacterium]
DLAKALKTLDRAAFPSVLKGMVSILLPNLGIPKNDADAVTNRRAAEALPILCRDRKALELILGQVAQVQRQHASYGKQLLEKSYQELKQRFMAQVQQKLEQQGVRAPSVRVDIDSMPEFQAQWRAVAARIEQQYEPHLARFREQIRELVLAKPALP